jgi:hypothetical protein
MPATAAAEGGEGPGLFFPRNLAHHRQGKIRVPMGDLFRGQRSRPVVPGRHSCAHGNDAAGGLGRKLRPELTSLDTFPYHPVKVAHLAIALGEDRAAAWLVEAPQLTISEKAFLLVFYVAKDMNPDQSPEPFRRVIGCCRIRFLAAADQLVHSAVHNREQECLLGSEMVV